MKKGQVSWITISFLLAVVTAIVLIIGFLRPLPAEAHRLNSCEARLGFCHDESTCPDGTIRKATWNCPEESQTCCFGIRSDGGTSAPSSSSAQTIIPGEATVLTPERPTTTPPPPSEHREAITSAVSAYQRAREAESIADLDAVGQTLMGIIRARYRLYAPHTARAISSEDSPMDYNTVKAFELLSLVEETSFRVAPENRKESVSQRDYFDGMCLRWAFLIRNYLDGTYRSEYSISNWMPNKDRVLRTYSSYISMGENSPYCTVVRSMSTSQIDGCKRKWQSTSSRESMLAARTPTSGTWGSCMPFAELLKDNRLDSTRGDFGLNLFYPISLTEIFTEGS